MLYKGEKRYNRRRSNGISACTTGSSPGGIGGQTRWPKNFVVGLVVELAI